MKVDKKPQHNYFTLDLWGKQIHILHIVHGHATNDIIIQSQDRQCPKCGTPYPEIKHGDSLTCQGCGADYRFHGACNPEVIGQTKTEVIDVAMEQGINLMQKRIE